MKRPRRSRPFRGSSEALAVLTAALASTLSKILVLVLPTGGTATLLATALTTTLTALPTLLTALLLAVALSRVTRVRVSHNTSNAKVNVDSGELLSKARRRPICVASIGGMKKGLTPVRFRTATAV